MSWASRHNLLAQAVNRHLGGVSVIWGAVSGEAILEQNSELVLRDQVVSVEHALHNLPVSLFGGMQYGDTVTVDGQSYAVRTEPMRIGDGRYCVVALERIEAIANYITTLAGLRLKTLDDRFLVTL